MFEAIAAMSAEALFGLGALAVLAAGILGLVTNMVLKDRGFGVALNGILMLFGFVAGVWTRFTIFGTL